MNEIPHVSTFGAQFYTSSDLSKAFKNMQKYSINSPDTSVQYSNNRRMSSNTLCHPWNQSGLSNPTTVDLQQKYKKEMP